MSLTCRMPFNGFFRKDQTSKTDLDLKSSILCLIKEFEGNSELTHPISQLSNRFGIKRRRLYDIINVFISIGCVKKLALDHVQWLGRETIYDQLVGYCTKQNILKSNMTLEQLFPSYCCIGISSLTLSFLMLFNALRTDKIDIRYASTFLSRDSKRYKTTLCKLYQICYILHSLGITSRSSTVCEIIMNPSYLVFSKYIKKIDDSIFQLLNRPVEQDSFILHRRKEFENCFLSNLASVSHIFDENDIEK